MPTNDAPISRRRLLVLALGAAALLALPFRAAPALADTPTDRATALVQGLSDQLIALLRSGRSEAQLYGEFEKLLARYGDIPVVAGSVLGPPWRGATPAQKQAFVAAFQTYLSRKYGKQFRDYQNASIRIVRARDAGKSGVLVETRVDRPGRDGFTVEWQVSERGGAPKVINLIIEGVSMLTNERAEIGAQYEAAGGNLDKLIASLKATA
ncbi:phospholipid-binding protein MlaC [Amaricoccus sp.]|uniref:MlaC/ttg2D family ABC transporter substrate-binding protein n=1 Tax=Amaricoccus sp. TaxID=1872485 RepID=UPI001B467FB8|nr:ABC transporter substrate-binding protein [Amaricoccus sp.]MBP7001648.1 ABC transporter substrate-binding protein [Amaricoccus sp.]